MASTLLGIIVLIDKGPLISISITCCYLLQSKMENNCNMSCKFDIFFLLENKNVMILVEKITQFKYLDIFKLRYKYLLDAIWH